MPALFYADQLNKDGSGGGGAFWDIRHAQFPVTQIFATIQLSRYGPGSGIPRFAEGYIVSSETPMIAGGGFSFPARRDSVVYLRTGALTYQLEVENAFASAAFTVFDATPEAHLGLARVERRLDVAIHDDEGNVVGTDRTVLLEGGENFDDDATVEQALQTAQARLGRSLNATRVDLSHLANGATFRIDTSSGAAVGTE